MAIWRNGRLEGLKILWAEMPVWVRIPLWLQPLGALAQLTRASDLHSEGREFESHTLHQNCLHSISVGSGNRRLPLTFNQVSSVRL